MFEKRLLLESNNSCFKQTPPVTARPQFSQRRLFETSRDASISLEETPYEGFWKPKNQLYISDYFSVLC